HALHRQIAIEFTIGLDATDGGVEIDERAGDAVDADALVRAFALQPEPAEIVPDQSAGFPTGAGVQGDGIFVAIVIENVDTIVELVGPDGASFDPDVSASVLRIGRRGERRRSKHQPYKSCAHQKSPKLPFG